MRSKLIDWQAKQRDAACLVQAWEECSLEEIEFMAILAFWYWVRRMNWEDALP